MIKNDLLTRFMSINGCDQTEDCSSLFALPVHFDNEDILAYFRNYVPNQMYFSIAGGLRFLSGVDIQAEIDPEAWPGGIVVNYGFFPIARTIGGNLVCISNKDGSVHMADHSYIREDRVCYYDDSNTRLLSTAISSESLQQFTPLLATNLNEMIENLLEGEDTPYAKRIFDLG